MLDDSNSGNESRDSVQVAAAGQAGSHTVARRTANSERKRAADAAIAAAVARSLRLNGGQLAAAIEAPASAVGDMATTAKPYPLRMLRMLAPVDALALLKEIELDIILEMRGLPAAHVTQQNAPGVAAVQQVRSCAAYSAGGVNNGAAYGASDKSTMGSIPQGSALSRGAR